MADYFARANLQNLEKAQRIYLKLQKSSLSNNDFSSLMNVNVELLAFKN